MWQRHPDKTRSPPRGHSSDVEQWPADYREAHARCGGSRGQNPRERHRGLRLRSASDAPAKEPSARPLMKDVSVAAKAKIDGPTIIASTRVHTTSYMNVANPVSANTAAASAYRVRSTARLSVCAATRPRPLTRGRAGTSTERAL